MEKLIEIGLLYDFYGPLLTERRKTLVQLYYEEDLSLAEIAAETNVTRQSVYDALRHAQRQLEGYEAQLGLMARYQAMESEMETCRTELSKVIPAKGSEQALMNAKDALKRIERIQ